MLNFNVLLNFDELMNKIVVKQLYQKIRNYLLLIFTFIFNIFLPLIQRDRKKAGNKKSISKIDLTQHQLKVYVIN